MLGLISNEFIKLRYRKKFIITVIILAALCALFAFADVKFSKLQTPDAQINTYKQAVTSIQNEKNNTKDEKKQAQLQDQIDQINLQINQLQLSKAADSDNWKDSLNNSINELKQQRDTASDLTEANSKEYFNKQIITNQYYIDHNIRPEKSGDVSAQSFLQGLIALIGAIFIPIIIAILVADIVSGEYTPPTMKVLLTRPITRNKLLLSKFLSAILSSFAVIIIIELISYVIMGLIFGFGNPLNPVTVGTTYTKAIISATAGQTSLIPVFGSTSIMPAWQFIILIFLFQLIYIFACSSIFFLLSTILKSSSISMTISILIPIVFIILGQIPYLQKIWPFLFTTYGSAGSVLSNSLAPRLGVTYATPLFSVIFLIAIGIICYIISHVVFRKKDLLL